jgi:hypothetical protein
VFVHWVILFSVIIFGSSVSAILAQDAETMLKQLNKELRQAERDMFGGKTDKSIAALENIKQLLENVKAADPNNTKIKTAENKYKKLVKDLERRTGKSLGGGTKTAEKSSSETALPEKSKPKSMPSKKSTKTGTAQKTKSAVSQEKVPYAARKPLSSATQQLKSLERNLDNLKDPDYGGNKDQLVENIEKKLVAIQHSLDEAKNLAAQKGVTAHPDFDQVEFKLQEAKTVVEGNIGDYEKVKTEAAAKSSEVNTDVAALKSEYDQVSSVFEKATGYVSHYNDLETVEKLIVEIENFEINKSSKLKQSMDAFAKKYGTTKAEIDKKAGGMGYSGQYRASFPYTELAEGIENVKKTRVVMAEDLVKRATENLNRMQKVHDFFVVEQYGMIKDWFNMASRFDDDNPKVKQAQAGIEQRIAEGMKELNSKIDKRKWPSHASNAPSNAEDLAEVALKWFKNSPDWGKRAKDPRYPLNVVVTGPWSVQQKNLLGEPIMYGLPVLLAVQFDGDKDQNLARVFILTLRTVEKRGVKMEPPFDHATVGDSYFIRPSAL